MIAPQAEWFQEMFDSIINFTPDTLYVKLCVTYVNYDCFVILQFVHSSME